MRNLTFLIFLEELVHKWAWFQGIWEFVFCCKTSLHIFLQFFDGMIHNYAAQLYVYRPISETSQTGP